MLKPPEPLIGQPLRTAMNPLCPGLLHVSTVCVRIIGVYEYDIVCVWIYTVCNLKFYLPICIPLLQYFNNMLAKIEIVMTGMLSLCH